ncbi:MAG: PrgI family protein [Lachnospiraceae bacterium]|nr:PrgI family protein [Lachnospiraceae bacterium]
MLSVEINRDLEEYHGNFFIGLSLKQCATVVISAGICIGTVVLLEGKIGLTASCYLSIPVVAPICLNGFDNRNGMNFTERVKRTCKGFVQKPLLYVSEERPVEVVKTFNK